jgi:hypothetical protein
MTVTPLPRAYAIALLIAVSLPEPPSDMLMMFAPWSAA